MRKLMLVILLVLGIAATSWPQSASDLKAKYPALTAYEVRPGILMMPLFSSDGQVCEMVLEQHTTNTKTKTTINFDSPLSKETLQGILDEVAPPAQRGKELNGINNWFGSVTVDGPFVITKYEYENVTVEVNQIQRSPASSGHIVVDIKWRNRTCNDTKQGVASAPILRQNSKQPQK
jgi:hypothetical protein